MLDIIGSEFIKLKKNKMIFITTIPVLLLPMLIILKDLSMEHLPSYMEWITTMNMLVGILLPIMSGFLITYLIQREYQERTIINILTAPVSRISFVLAKLTVWFIWYLLMIIFIEIITVFGYKILFPENFNLTGLTLVIKLLTKANLFIYVASIPLLWVTIKQKTMFYPSMMTAFAFMIIGMAGTQTSMKMAKIAVIVPWSAATLASMIDSTSIYFVIGIISVILCGIIGTGLSIYAFLKQDQ